MGEHSQKYDSGWWEQTVTVDEVIPHPNYQANKLSYPNDIALVKLSHKVTLNKYVQIANLAEKGSSFYGQECVLAGWGITEWGSPDLLQEVCNSMLI